MSAVGRRELLVLFAIESEDGLVPVDEDRSFDEIGLLHHQIYRFLLRLWKRALLEYRTSRTDEVQEALLVDVAFEQGTVWRVLVDVALADVHPMRIQKTSGIAARGSGRLPVEDGAWHGAHSTAGASLFPRDAPADPLRKLEFPAGQLGLTVKSCRDAGCAAVRHGE